MTAGDAATVVATVQTVNVNQTGELDQTFLGLALTRTAIDLAIVQALLEAGADPNEKQGWPLSVALGRRNAALTVLLLNAGADSSLSDSMGRPAFFNALDRADLLAVLLARGVRIDAVDSRGWTAVMHAVWDSQWPTVALLLDAGAELGHVAPDGDGIDKALAFVRYRAGLENRPIPPELLALEVRIAGRPSGVR